MLEVKFFCKYFRLQISNLEIHCKNLQITKCTNKNVKIIL